jgi:hypothetical protein
MYFTQDDYLKIHEWLKRNSVRDSELPEMSELSDDDIITLINNGDNKKIKIKTFIDAVIEAQRVTIQDLVDNIELLNDIKQDKLISGNNISTINGQSLLSGGDIKVKSSAEGNNLISDVTYNNWYKSNVTINPNINEGLYTIQVGGGFTSSPSIALTKGKYVISFNIKYYDNREYPNFIGITGENITNITSNIGSIATGATSISSFKYLYMADIGSNTNKTSTAVIKFEVTSDSSDFKIGFESKRYSIEIDSIKLEEGENATQFTDFIYQKQLVSGLNIKTINGQSLLGGGNIEITGDISEFVNGGIVNITQEGTIEAVYNRLDKGGVALCFIGDSNGNYPSTSNETRVNVHSKYCNSLNYFFSTDPRGANVGDLLLITKQTYMYVYTICALKIIPINDAKVAADGFIGTDGIMTAGDKQRLTDVIYQSQDTRNWLSSVNDTLERNIHRTRFGYGVALNDCITTGVCAYTPAEINGINENWTLFVDCSSDGDTSGYYHFTQTAIGRTGSVTGKIYQRLGWYKKEGNTIVDLNFLAWQDGSGDSGSGNEYVDVFHCIVDVSTDEIIDCTPEILKAPIVGISAIQKGDEVVDYVLSLRDLEGNVLYVMGGDYTYIFGNDGGTWVLAEKNPTYTERFATKDEVSTAIANAITNTLNTEV